MIVFASAAAGATASRAAASAAAGRMRARVISGLQRQGLGRGLLGAAGLGGGDDLELAARGPERRAPGLRQPHLQRLAAPDVERVADRAQDGGLALALELEPAAGRVV